VFFALLVVAISYYFIVPDTLVFSVVKWY